MHINPITHIARDARILIVDDEERNVDALGQILSRAGYAICISLTDPRKAVAQFEAIQPDILLLDWHMGEFTGLDVLREIKKHTPVEKMPPVLVLTADDSTMTKREALNAGASDFLSKPLDFPEVLLRIRNLLLLRMFHQRDQEAKRSLEEQVREKTSELERTLTELRESQHQVIQQERLRALGTMASGVAHDFNNMLTVIEGYSGMFMNKEQITADLDGAAVAFGMVRRAVSDSAQIVRRLREFYRPFTSGQDDRRPVDVRDLVEEAVQLSAPRWKTQTQANGVFIDVKMELAEVPAIHGSSAELREVMMNLIFNAVDAMPQGGQIVVRSGVEEDKVFFEVGDSGLGMTEETRRHCLEPFYTTKGEQGTGLGLATTYGIVRRHGGIIHLDSQVGQGTRVTILLPIGEPAELPAKAAEAATEPTAPASGVETTVETTVETKPAGESAQARSLRVLVVDDQPEICTVLKHYLERDAHKVETAGDGRDALEKFRDEKFDVVITDRVMPEMNGDQLASAVKKMCPGEPVILITAFAEESEKPSPDVDMLLRKPASLHQIREAIQQVMAA